MIIPESTTRLRKRHSSHSENDAHFVQSVILCTFYWFSPTSFLMPFHSNHSFVWLNWIASFVWYHLFLTDRTVEMTSCLLNSLQRKYRGSLMCVQSNEKIPNWIKECMFVWMKRKRNEGQTCRLEGKNWRINSKGNGILWPDVHSKCYDHPVC